MAQVPSPLPSPSKPIISETEKPDPQQPFSLLNESLEKTATALKLGGLVGTEITPRVDGLIIYWYGPVPQVIADVITSSGVRAEIRAVRYSYQQLIAETRQIAMLPAVRYAGSGDDFQSINVVVSAGVADAARAEINQLPSRRIPFEIEEHGTGEMVDLERQTDTPAFWGGATIVSANRVDICSLGFTGKFEYYWRGSNGNGTTLPGRSVV